MGHTDIQHNGQFDNERLVNYQEHEYQYSNYQMPSNDSYTSSYNYYDHNDQNQYSQSYLSMGMENMNIQNPQKLNQQLDGYFFGNQQRHQFYAPYQPLQHHLYTPPAPHVVNVSNHQKSSHYFFVSEKLREYLVEKSEAIHTVLDPNGGEAQLLPLEVHVYHTLYPLGVASERVSKVFGFQTSLYKAIRSLDGGTYCLRRIENYRLQNELSIGCIESWTKLQHSGIVSVREGFTTIAFGDVSLVLVYDYHPLSVTLASKYLSNSGPYHGGLKEDILWSFICQITNALKTIHSSNLAARVLEPSKILITGVNRFRINCCGIFDILTFDDRRTVSQHQQDDLLNFGQIILGLACGSMNSLHDLSKSIEYITSHYSPDLKEVVLYLLYKPGYPKTIDAVLQMIAPRLLHDLNSALIQNDVLEDELGRECENSRLVRLLCKLGHINERPEFELDPTWSETGDRYLLKLFRDYVFHQVSPSGEAVIDLSHVITCLNKLDTGVEEKVMLMSRDEKSCLIVSYRELKQCVDTTFRELVRRKGRLET
ncbi:hypothetical protein BC833DRAFT_597801 [Globomyces pollinis-pini]|nr:hypothetical protein BC833DRAFT_597801 [Globomyces pollinis-pini]